MYKAHAVPLDSCKFECDYGCPLVTGVAEAGYMQLSLRTLNGSVLCRQTFLLSALESARPVRAATGERAIYPCAAFSATGCDAPKRGDGLAAR